VPEWTIGTAC